MHISHVCGPTHVETGQYVDSVCWSYESIPSLLHQSTIELKINSMEPKQISNYCEFIQPSGLCWSADLKVQCQQYKF